MADMFLSLVIWKLSLCQKVEVIAYVDDIHVIAESAATLLLSLATLNSFSQHFCLKLALAKSFLWGTDVQALQKISDLHGIPVSNALVALGMEWRLTRQVQPAYKKELKRLLEAKERLRRLKWLAASTLTLISAISTGCLSLIDYSGIPRLKEVSTLALPVKIVLGVPSGAPEIALHGLCKGTIDPTTRWIMSLLRLWHASLAHPDAREMATHPKKLPESRFRLLFDVCGKKGIGISEHEVAWGDMSVRTSLAWAEFRVKILMLLKKNAWEALARRRPKVYGGLSALNIALHRKLLKRLGAYDASVILRVWTGCPMTLSHRRVIEKNCDGICECDLAVQDIPHLLFSCPLRASSLPALSAWSSLPPVCSSALLFPSFLSPSLFGAWEQVCRRCIQVLSTRKAQHVPFNPRGHLIVHDIQEGYSFCCHCYVSRRIRDAHFIAVRECQPHTHGPACIGDYMRIRAHTARLHLAVWKRHSRRPRWRCEHCAHEWWATSTPALRCVSGPA